MIADVRGGRLLLQPKSVDIISFPRYAVARTATKQTKVKLQTLKKLSLVSDAAKVKRNAELMTQRVKQLGADLRPHIKTHK